MRRIKLCVKQKYENSFCYRLSEFVKLWIDFSEKPFWFFPLNFLDSRFHTVEKQKIILKHCCYNSYTSVVLNDSEDNFLKERKNEVFYPFFFCALFIDCVEKSKYGIKYLCSSYFRRYLVEALSLSAFVFLIIFLYYVNCVNYPILMSSWRLIMFLIGYPWVWCFQVDSWNVLSISIIFRLGWKLLVLLLTCFPFHSLHSLFAMLIVILSQHAL